MGAGLGGEKKGFKGGKRALEETGLWSQDRELQRFLAAKRDRRGEGKAKGQAAVKDKRRKKLRSVSLSLG